MEQIALIAAGTWALTEVIRKAWKTILLDGEVVAVIVGLVIGVAAYYTGYLTGQPVEVGLKLLLAILAANLAHDKVVAPLTGNRL